MDGKNNLRDELNRIKEWAWSKSDAEVLERLTQQADEQGIVDPERNKLINLLIGMVRETRAELWREIYPIMNRQIRNGYRETRRIIKAYNDV